jgi:hypothetical protein
MESSAGMTQIPQSRPESQPQAQSAVVQSVELERCPFYRDPVIVLVFLSTFALYLASMPKTVALEDDSIFILAGYFNGISHPPGYPLYTLVLNWFTQIPLGDIPSRAHASSAFFGALSCCTLFCIFCLTGLERQIAALGAFVFSVTATFWSQAIITEVYSLNVFLNLCLLLFALRIFLNFRPDTQGPVTTSRDFYLFSIVLGLALSNHWPLTVLATPAYLLLICRPYLRLHSKLPVVLPAIAISAAAYLYLYWNNQSSPFINFSGQFANFAEFIEYVMRKHYASVDFQSTAGWQDKVLFARDLAQQFARELNLLLVFSALGLYQLVKEPDSRVIGLAMIWVVLSNSLLLVLLVNFDYSLLYSLVFSVYPIVSIAMLFVLAGFGMHNLIRRENPMLASKHLVIILLLALALNVFFSLPQNYRHHYSWGEEYAQRILSELPINAALFSDGEVELGLLSYHHFVKGHRPDIQIYSSSGLLLDNRLFDYRLEDKKTFIETLVNENLQQNYYAANNYYNVTTDTGSIFTDKLGKPVGESKHSVNSNDVDLLVKWSAEDYTHDPWTEIAISNLRKNAIAVMTPVLKSAADANLRKYISSSILGLIRSEADALVYLKSSINEASEINPEVLRTQLDDINRDNLLSKQEDSLLVYLIARSTQAQQTEEHLNNSRQQACQNWPSPKNTYCREDTGR